VWCRVFFFHPMIIECLGPNSFSLFFFYRMVNISMVIKSDLSLTGSRFMDTFGGWLDYIFKKIKFYF
jgi:hypothetical protein